MTLCQLKCTSVVSKMYKEAMWFKQHLIWSHLYYCRTLFYGKLIRTVSVCKTKKPFFKKKGGGVWFQRFTMCMLFLNLSIMWLYQLILHLSSIKSWTSDQHIYVYKIHLCGFLKGNNLFPHFSGNRLTANMDCNAYWPWVSLLKCLPYSGWLLHVFVKEKSFYIHS